MKYLTTLYVALLFVGCGTIKETTTEETTPVNIPPIVVHDTVMVAIPYMVEVQNGIDIDSAKRDYFVKNCKGTLEIDKDGLRATITYLSRDNKGKSETITQLTAEVEKKEQIIQSTKKVTIKSETPSEWWIWTHSFLYQFLASAFTATILIILQIKKKIIP